MPIVRVTPYQITSNTYAFAPSFGELASYCFERCGIKRGEITANHLIDARMTANVILSDWANEQVNLWEVDVQTVDLVVGQAQYAVAPNTVLILDAYIRLNATSPEPTDLPIYPYSRTEYASIPEKYVLGRPTVYWFDRLIQPSVTLWEVPDQASPVYQFVYYRVRQIQDAIMSEGEQIEMPYRFVRAFTDALSVRLAAIYAPEKMTGLEKRAAVSFEKAKRRDAEDAPLFIADGLESHYNQI